jgi:hypothetical protein
MNVVQAEIERWANMFQWRPARRDTGIVLQVVKLPLEKEGGRSSSDRLSDAIRCLSKLAQSENEK